MSMNLETAINLLRSVPGLRLDIGWRSGREAVIAQMQTQFGRDVRGLVDSIIEEMQQSIDDLQSRALPHMVPTDYVAFLERYGGFSIFNPPYRLAVYGVGPMAEEWYRSVESEDVILDTGKVGLLSVGVVGFDRGNRLDQYCVEFDLDLAGHIQKDAVIAVGPYSGKPPLDFAVDSSQPHLKNVGKVVAVSFTSWLVRAVETKGTFDF